MDPLMTDKQFDFESRLSRLEERIDNLYADFHEIAKDVRTIRNAMSRFEGSLKFAGVLFGSIVALGTLVAAIVPYVLHH